MPNSLLFLKYWNPNDTSDIASQRDRHTLRCKKRNRSRKRACLPCSRAKSRCDQQTPACNRCLLKELACVYAHADYQRQESEHQATSAPPMPAGSPSQTGSRLAAGAVSHDAHEELTPAHEQAMYYHMPATPLSTDEIQSRGEAVEDELLAALLASPGASTNDREPSQMYAFSRLPIH